MSVTIAGGAVGTCSAAVLPRPVSYAGGRPLARPGASAVQRYVEDVPTADGQSTPGVTKPAAAPLSPAALARLPIHACDRGGVGDGAASPAYGAPRPLRRMWARRIRLPRRGIAASTADAIGTASDAPLVGLLVVLIAASMGAVGLAVRSARA